MEESRGLIVLVSPEDATLGHALAAALTSRGWTVLRVTPAGVPPGGGLRTVVVLLEDDDGRCAVGLPVLLGTRATICIGSVRSLQPLQFMQRRGAVVLNQSAPLLSLLGHVENAVRNAAGLRAVHPAVALHRRIAERQRLVGLTASEDSVLRWMLAGAGALQISVHAHLSIHTIRSHIKAVLGKLGVRSQLEAVAIAHRAGAMRWRADAIAKFTNSGEDDRVGTDGQ